MSDQYDRSILHAKFTLPKPQVHAQHPLRNADNHCKLLEYLEPRLLMGKDARDRRVSRYVQIDRDVAAWMKLSTEDQKRQDKHERDGTPAATAISLPLTWVHLDDMMTYYAQTFSPNRGMFYHTAPPGEGESAADLVTIMNNHAIYGSYYRHLLRSIFAMLKYNVGGIVANWATDYGPSLEVDQNQQTTVTQKPVFNGNKIHAIDMYNAFWDPAIEPTNLYNQGEWFAHCEMKSHFWLKNKCLEGAFFNCEKILDGTQQNFATNYYKDPPEESKMDMDSQGSGRAVNWYAWMGGMGESYLVNNAFQLMTTYIKINPNDFGLVPGTAADRAKRNQYEVWRITIANDETIIECTPMTNIHGYLPAFFGVINDDFMREGAKSPAEILNPLQQFSSFLLNAHVLANRKNIFGTTFYDPSRVDYGSVPEGEVAARVPIKPQGYGQDLRTMVQHDNNTLDTKQTLQDLKGMIEIIDQFFPTQSLPSQIAGIDRAVDSQVAAVQQGANRRQQKGARLIDDTMMRPFRFALYYNIVQFQPDGEDVADYFKGTQQKVDLSKLRDMNLVYLIGQGLKAIDRQQVASQMQQLIFALIQAPSAAQQIDILGMLDYWTTMLDVDTNMKQFALPPPPAAAAPGVPGAAPAGGNQIAPATAPAAITEPIYGS